MAYNFTTFKNSLKDSQDWLIKEFTNIRTGRATPSILDGVKVDSYGSLMTISQVGSITIEDARSIRITPWDSSQIKSIEKAIVLADLGVSVVVDDKGLRVIFPELTGESRAIIAKHAKDRVEEAKKRIRASRDDVMRDLQAKEKEGEMGKDDVFRAKAEAQKFVDETNNNIEALYIKKEKEILS